MSKRLPYYQSEPAEYLAGDIMYCSYAAQGIFSIISALYWQKDCKLTLSQVKRRCKDADSFIQELIDENIIKVDGDTIIINFLIEQFKKASGKSKTNSENGKKGAAKRWANKNIDSKSIATPLKSNSESIALREDKIREDKEDNIYTDVSKDITEQLFLKRWKDARFYYDKKPTNITKFIPHERVNFEDLKKDYNLANFEQAMQGMFQQKTFPKTRLRPTHFLCRENFETYLTCYSTNEVLFPDNKFKKPIERI